MIIERVLELRLLDCNCVECVYYSDDSEKNKNHLIFNPENILQSGYCSLFKSSVTVIPNILQLDTQDCYLDKSILRF